MKKIFWPLMAAALLLVSCSKSSQDDPKVSYTTRLQATVTLSFTDIYEYSFTLGGKPITMTKTQNGNTAVLTFTDDQLHANEKIECTVTVVPTADVEALPNKVDFTAESDYKSYQPAGSGYAQLYLSSGQAQAGGLSYDKMVEQGKVTDKASFAKYIGSKISTALSGTLKPKSE